MADLITAATLAKWTQNDESEVAADPLAVEIMSKLSALVRFIGGHDEWTLDAGENRLPIDVEMTLIQVAKRSYENPTQVTTEGSTGPLGGDQHVDGYALFMDFTDAERATISKYNPDGDPTPQAGQGEIFTLTTTRGDETTLKTAVLYVTDDQQVALAESADPRPWMIPLFNPGDPGDPNNYDE